MNEFLINIVIVFLIFALGSVAGFGFFALIKINKVDALEYSNKLRCRINDKLKCYLNCWEVLTDKDNDFLTGKVESMKTAIYLVNAEFDKSESEVK